MGTVMRPGYMAMHSTGYTAFGCKHMLVSKMVDQPAAVSRQSGLDVSETSF